MLGFSFFFQAEDGIRDLVRSRGLGDVYKRQMQKVCKLHGDKLKVKNGKLFIEDEGDIDLALKMLADYYKRGEVSGKAYGTFAGKQLTTTE